jgi:hypothetical protein
MHTEPATVDEAVYQVLNPYLTIIDMPDWLQLNWSKVQVFACTQMKKPCFEIVHREIVAPILFIM